MSLTSSDRLIPSRRLSILVNSIRPVRLVFCCALITICSAFASAQTVKILEPEIPANAVWVAPGVVDLKFEVSADVKSVRVVVTTKNDAAKSVITIDPATRQYTPTVNLLKGVNKIELFAFKEGQDEPSATAAMTVTCSGKKCGGAGAPGDTGAVTLGGGGGGGVQTPPKPPGNIVILTPSADKPLKDAIVTSVISVKKSSNIQTLLVLVKNDGKAIEQPKSKVLVKYGDDDVAIVKANVHLKKGDNTITFVNVDNPLEDADKVSVKVTCDDDKCNAATPAVANAIRINSPEAGTQSGPSVASKITIIDSSITRVFVRVLNNGKPLEKPVVDDGDTLNVQFAAGQTEVVLKPKIRIGKGTNVITVFDAAKSIETGPQDSTEITCNDDCGEVAVAHNGPIVIDVPDDAKFVDATIITPDIKVTDANIHKVFIRVLNGDKPIAQTQETMDVVVGNNPSKIKIGPGKNVIKVFNNAEKDSPESDSVVVQCVGPKCGTGSDIETEATAFTRAIVGIEQAAAASANPEQKLFLEFNLTAPIFKKKDSAIQAPLWLWLNPRITSLPQQTAGSVAEFSTAANFFAPFTSGKVNDIVQGFEFTGGFEIPFKLPNNRSRVTAPIASGFGPESRVRFGVSALIGGGVAAPFSSQKSVQVFKVNTSITDRFPGALGKDFIAFTAGDRNRFFRQYFVGLRLKSYYVKKSNIEELDSIFPGILDVTFGQNEAVTGGDLHGGVVKIEGIYPLPFIKGGQRGSVYVFGSALMKLSRPKILPPIFLQLPDATVAFPAANVFIQQVPPRDSDHYRIGVGVDLIRLLKRNNQ